MLQGWVKIVEGGLPIVRKLIFRKLLELAVIFSSKYECMGKNCTNLLFRGSVIRVEGGLTIIKKLI